MMSGRGGNEWGWDRCRVGPDQIGLARRSLSVQNECRMTAEDTLVQDCWLLVNRRMPCSIRSAEETFSDGNLHWKDRRWPFGRSARM